MLSNVTVTGERQEKYNFSTCRADALVFSVPAASALTAIAKPADVAGRQVVIAGSGTNPEQILRRWSETNRANGLKPTELQYDDDDAVRVLALQSGRADAQLGPNALAAFEGQRDGKTHIVSTSSGGWPLTAGISVVTPRAPAWQKQ